MDHLLTQTIGLLIIAVLVALGARALRLPYTVGLVAVGMALALLPGAANVVLTHDFAYDFILPPLLFEAAINIHWHDLKRDLAVVLGLAVFATLIAAALVTAGLVAGLGWPIKSALLFGILIAATDPGRRNRDVQGQ